MINPLLENKVVLITGANHGIGVCIGNWNSRYEQPRATFAVLRKIDGQASCSGMILLGALAGVYGKEGGLAGWMT